jgi:hypothetical protein
MVIEDMVSIKGGDLLVQLRKDGCYQIELTFGRRNIFQWLESKRGVFQPTA